MTLDLPSLKKLCERFPGTVDDFTCCDVANAARTAVPQLIEEVEHLREYQSGGKQFRDAYDNIEKENTALKAEIEIQRQVNNSVNSVLESYRAESTALKARAEEHAGFQSRMGSRNKKLEDENTALVVENDKLKAEVERLQKKIDSDRCHHCDQEFDGWGACDCCWDAFKSSSNGIKAENQALRELLGEAKKSAIWRDCVTTDFLLRIDAALK